MYNRGIFSRVSTGIWPHLALAAVLALLATVMLVWTWMAWPDLLIDFGRELYLAWRLSEGERLYADVAHFNGPFSPYVNSLWFRAFGTGIRTLVVANLVILALIATLLYVLLLAASDRFSAAVAGLVFISLFAFSHLSQVGNYNYLTPYSHEMTHGLLLSLISIGSVLLYARDRRLRWLIGAGFGLGIVFLTKVEIFLAAAMAASVGVLLTPDVSPGRTSRVAGRLAWLVGPALLPPLIAWLLLSAVMPMEEALEGLLRPYIAPLEAHALSLPFYREIMGTSDLGANLGEMLKELVWGLAFFGIIAVLAFIPRGRGPRAHLTAGVAFALGSVVPSFLWDSYDWLNAGRSLPVIVLVLLVATLFRDRRKTTSGDSAASRVARVALLVFGAVLLLKILFNAHISHYGFVLAMPATLLLIVALFGWIPKRIQQLGGQGLVFRGGALGLLLVAVTVHLAVVRFQITKKSDWVGAGADRIRTDELRGPVVSRTIEEIDRHLAPNQTLAVWPEGVMLNYLARRLNSTPYISLMPPELAIYGESRILAAFQENPPDAVALVHWEIAEYGVPFFETDYGQRLLEWVDAEYCAVFADREPRLRPEIGFGIELRLRKTATRSCSSSDRVQGLEIGSRTVAAPPTRSGGDWSIEDPASPGGDLPGPSLTQTSASESS